MGDKGARPKLASPHANRVLEALRGRCRDGRPWSDLSDAIDNLSARDLHVMFGVLGLRKRLYKPAGEAPAWHRRAVAARRDELPEWTRAQMLHFAEDLALRVRQKCMHVYQVYGMPSALVRRAYAYYALTFARSDGAAVAKDDAFVLVNEARANVLYVRDHRLGGGDVVPMWDYRILRFDVEPHTHRVLLGGAAPGGGTSRCEDAFHFNYAPRGTHGQAILYRKLEDTIQTGLDAHWAVEQACCAPSRSQALTPEMPRVWLGFVHDDDVAVEQDAPGLLHDAWQHVTLWVQAGRPDNWPLLPCLGKQKDPRFSNLARRVDKTGFGWRDVVKQIGQWNANHIVEQAMARRQVVTRDGLNLLPLDYFLPGSPQKPLVRAVKVYLEMTALLGRLSSDPRQERCEVDRTQARVQVVRLENRGQLDGYCDGVHYDFKAVPFHLEPLFAVPPRQ